MNTAATRLPSDVPASQKTRTAINLGERLSRQTYLNSPRVFGFYGVYKPFAVDADVLAQELVPAERCVELVRAWEHDQQLVGFADEVPGTDRASTRRRIHEEVRSALQKGFLTVATGAQLLGRLATTLRPDECGPTEAAVLRRLVLGPRHEHRRELALLLERDDLTATEPQLLAIARQHASPALSAVIDAVVSYEELAVLVNAAFRLLCSVSYSLGGQPLTAAHVADDEMLDRCAREIPELFKRASDRVAEAAHGIDLEQRLGEFTYPARPANSPSSFCTITSRSKRVNPAGSAVGSSRCATDGSSARPTAAPNDRTSTTSSTRTRSHPAQVHRAHVMTVRLLEYWSAPQHAGQPMACLATTFTFDADFFAQDRAERQGRVLRRSVSEPAATFRHQRLRMWAPPPLGLAARGLT